MSLIVLLLLFAYASVLICGTCTVKFLRLIAELFLTIPFAAYPHFPLHPPSWDRGGVIFRFRN